MLKNPFTIFCKQALQNIDFKQAYVIVYPSRLRRFTFMPRITKLPNYCNGRLYKRWDSVYTIFGDGILATKTTKNGTPIELLITEKGRKRELFFQDEKVMDTIDSKGIKRTYTYTKDKNNTTKGQMFVQPTEEGQTPLITAAKWFTQKLFLKLNPKHPLSKIYIPQIDEEGNAVYTGEIKRIEAVEILAKDFENAINPIPKTILIKDKKGSVIPVTANSKIDLKDIATPFHINSAELGQNITTVV